MTFSAAGKRFVLFSAIEAAVLCCICALLFRWNALSGEKGFHTLGEIRDEGVLHVGVLMNPMEYYLHQGKVGGFAYELVQVLADSMHVKPSYHVYYTYEDINMALLRNDVDLLAAAETPTPEWRAFFSFTHPLFVSDVVSLSRRGSSDSAVDFGMLPSPVFAGLSARALRGHPHWRPHIYQTSEDQLLEVMDRDGKPDAALVMGVYWRAYSVLFPNLAVKDTLPGRLPLCWAVRRGNDSLLLTVDRFLKNYGKERDFARLRRKYTDPNSSERNRLAENSRLIPFGSISR
ncbi:MAG: transporter substrate-binding domain-containing protein, partial [Bacteroidales bacterium]|nr:transporter substrate-binding domain-containing protein [Bacteroidales bacterium]